MAERVKVECSCGKPFTTAVRGRGTHCPGCGRTVYVRTDGTVRPPAAAPAGGGRAKGRRSVSAPAAVAEDPGAPDHRTATDEEWLARELWEGHHYEGTSVEQLAKESRPPKLTVAKVRRLIAAEVARQERMRAAKGAPAVGSPSRSPRRRAA